MNQQLQEFCRRWMLKADEAEGDNIKNMFDKFFSLFVVYNRLYVEATLILNNQGDLNLNPDSSFPDKNASTAYLLQYYGCRELKNQLETKNYYTEHFNSLKNIIQNRLFNVCLNPVTGNSNREKDLLLLSNLNSNNCNEQMLGVLEFIYQVRCNMFHGRKGYEPVQELLLEPTLFFLNEITNLLFEKLINGNQ